MAYTTPTLDGQAVFGRAVHTVMEPCDLAMSYSAFFGVNGQYSVFGGSRGRRFDVSGVLAASSVAGLIAARAALLSFQDGAAHILLDTYGVTWPWVVFVGGWKQGNRMLYVSGGLVGWEYSLELVSNT